MKTLAQKNFHGTKLSPVPYLAFVVPLSVAFAPLHTNSSRPLSIKKTNLRHTKDKA